MEGQAVDPRHKETLVILAAFLTRASGFESLRRLVVVEAVLHQCTERCLWVPEPEAQALPLARAQGEARSTRSVHVAAQLVSSEHRAPDACALPTTGVAS